MISRAASKIAVAIPALDSATLRTESDVEQKLLYPFLCHPSFVGVPADWLRTKDYMTPTEIDKIAGKRRGYVPDYSIWLGGLPLVIVEAKEPSVAVEVGLREARLYASEINKRYPPNLNPIGYVLSSNGEQIALSRADSEIDTLILLAREVTPGSAALDAIRGAIGKAALEAHAKTFESHFQTRRFYPTSAFLGGQQALSFQLGVNEFANSLFPLISRYFASNSDELPDEIIDRAYVSSDEITTYSTVLETYLKDRTRSLAGNQLQPIITSRNAASGITSELQKFSNNPEFYGRVQLIVGSVGAGKSTFIQRFYRRLLPTDLRVKTHWAFLNFNVMPNTDQLNRWIASEFISSFSIENNIDVYDLDQLEKIFAVELNRYDRGPARLIKKEDAVAYASNKASLLTDWMNDKSLFAEAICRHFGGERNKGIIVVFDNVDKRDRDQQLSIFEAAQWFKNITRALVIVTLRDTTFETHREEKPLDAFINAINFYIKAPRFVQVIRKRMELVIDSLPSEIDKRQEFSTETGIRVRYPSSRLGEFLVSIYASLFERRGTNTAAALEALVAKDVRRALGMFGDILVSPHIPTSQITGAALELGSGIREDRIIRTLMRGRARYFDGRSLYVRNVLEADPNLSRPSNMLIADILEYLIRNRKEKIDFSLEGYALVRTVVNKMSQLGYDEQDAQRCIEKLVQWGLLEPDSLVLESVSLDDAVRMHASGFIHMRYFLRRPEYLIGVTTNTHFSSRDVADEIGSVWASQAGREELTLAGKLKIMRTLVSYLKNEHQRRARRHAFYDENGFGGRIVSQFAASALEELEAAQTGGRRARI